MAKSETKLVFSTVNVDNNQKLKPAYDKVRVALSSLSVAREAFEKAFTAEAEAKKMYDPATHKIVFSYRFGQLSVAYADKNATGGSKAAAIEM